MAWHTRVQRQEGRRDLGQGAEDAHLGVVLLVDPQPREGRLGPDERQLVGRVLLVDVAEQIVERLQRRHQHGAVGDREAIDRLQPVPRPRLHALAQRVVDADRDVDVLGLVAGHVLLELFLAVGHDGEVLGRDAVTLRAVAVATEGNAPAPGLAGREHDAARDAGGKIFLKDAAVDDLADQGCHTLAPPWAGLPSRASGPVVRPRKILRPPWTLSSPNLP